MIDHLTPYEGVTFGALVALGVAMMAWGSGDNRMVAVSILATGVIGGLMTLFRGLAHKPASTGYMLLIFVGLILLALKLFVFPDSSGNRESNAWLGIYGMLASGIVGIGLNAIFREQHKSISELDEEAEDENASQLPPEEEAEEEENAPTAPESNEGES